VIKNLHVTKAQTNADKDEDEDEGEEEEEDSQKIVWVFIITPSYIVGDI